MARLVRLTQRYLDHARHLRALLGQRAMHDAGRAVAQLGAASELPGPGDLFTFVPDPDAHPDASRLLARARRVPKRNLWVWYWASDAQVQIVDLTVEPPRRDPE